MNKDPYRDQADKIKQKIERVHEEPAAPKKREPLPPRNELHREKKKKNKVKLKYPLISLLLLFFILMPLTVFSIYSYFDSRNEPLVVLSEGNNEVEEVQYDQNEEEEDLSDSSEEDSPAERTDEGSGVDVSGDSVDKNQSDQEADNTADKTKLPAAKAAEVEEPETAETDTHSDESKPAQESSSEIIYHTVQPQETIFRIAMKYYHSQDGIAKIKKANNLPSNEIQSGQVLKIPLSD
ncbi:LysM peptidoglycan-binding domain-containing protein [Bacillus haikouensis]|uniref:LysM peptidoglycan-binding domain-containing protein n=1 Tax=Bacillus haikouensis TaxID=1510468 RepID=UPI001557E194|nr:LysM peptidoglycan-binding domain-containing protein [Bacillus haikouensis]NQD65192.1 LysM peptidoglycan-binding domain-containing protein [Bacillus haikouensis]